MKSTMLTKLGFLTSSLPLILDTKFCLITKLFLYNYKTKTNKRRKRQKEKRQKGCLKILRKFLKRSALIHIHSKQQNL